MKPLPITGVASLARVAGEAPASLREAIRALCPAAPRRVNRLIEWGLLGAHTCVQGHALPPDTDIYMAFSSGCVADSVALVKNAVRDQPTMPVTFINVSSNMAGFYVASSLGLHSENQVVASRDFSWEAALELAMLNTADRRGLLVGAVEEAVWPLAEHRERLGLAPGAPVLESSQWLLVSRESTAPIATLQWIRRFPDDAALAQFLAAAPPAAGTALWVEGDDPARWQSRAGLPLAEGLAPEGHTRLPAALACCRFVAQRRAGALLHLHRGRAGAWYALRLEVLPRG